MTDIPEVDAASDVIEVADEDLVTAFIEAFNAGDFSRVDGLFAPEAELLGIVEDAETPAGVFQTLKLRTPWMTLARAELGLDPVASMWVPDEMERYQPVGFIAFDTADRQIVRGEVAAEQMVVNRVDFRCHPRRRSGLGQKVIGHRIDHLASDDVI